jgi:hypothetical protein
MYSNSSARAAARPATVREEDLHASIAGRIVVRNGRPSPTVLAGTVLPRFRSGQWRIAQLPRAKGGGHCSNARRPATADEDGHYCFAIPLR